MQSRYKVRISSSHQESGQLARAPTATLSNETLEALARDRFQMRLIVRDDRGILTDPVPGIEVVG